MAAHPHNPIAVLGPTASGKTAVALAVAERINGEIVSCDSMQVYRELTVGTAKPSAREMAAIPHHLVNVADISERYDTNRFVREAQAACRDITRRGKTPVLAGGTGLYAKALIYGFSMQPASPEVFKEVCQEADSPGGLAKLTAELRQAFGARSVPRDMQDNPRRLIRAVEILRLTGQPPAVGAEKNKDPGQGGRPDLHITQFVLLPPNPLLKLRIFARAGNMLENGWIAETRQLAALGLFGTPTAYQALGYREIRQWLEDGGEDKLALQTLIATKTWQYARRQMTWFRRQHPGAYLLTLRDDYTTSGIADAIASVIVGDCSDIDPSENSPEKDRLISVDRTC